MRAYNTFEHTTNEGLIYSFLWTAPLRETKDSFSHSFGVHNFTTTEEIPGMKSEDFNIRNLSVYDVNTGDELEVNSEHEHSAKVMAMIQYYTGNYEIA